MTGPAYTYQHGIDPYGLPIATDTFADVPGIPAAVLDAAAAYEEAYEAYADADADRAAAHETISGAADRDLAALREALREGRPDPGPVHHANAERAAYVEQERLRLTVADVNAARDTLAAAIGDNERQVLAALAAHELANVTRYTAAVQAAAAALTAATDAAQHIGRAFGEVADLLPNGHVLNLSGARDRRHAYPSTPSLYGMQHAADGPGAFYRDAATIYGQPTPAANGNTEPEPEPASKPARKLA